MSYWKKLVEFLVGPQGSGVRAKDSKGRYVADDKSTVDVNEAYEDGKTPAKKNKRTRTKGKYNEASLRYKGGRKPKSNRSRGRPRGSKNKKKWLNM